MAASAIAVVVEHVAAVGSTGDRKGDALACLVKMAVEKQNAPAFHECNNQDYDRLELKGRVEDTGIDDDEASHMDMVDTDQLNSDNYAHCNHAHHAFEHSSQNKEFVRIENDLGLDQE